MNAHTHLELTGFEEQAPEPQFFDWIRTVIRLKSEREPAAFAEFARQGLRQSFASGVTTIADTGDSGSAAHALADLGGRGIAYLEVFGPDPGDADRNFELFKERALALRVLESGRLRIGVSPHAPYSVSGALYRRVSQFAEQENFPIAVHLAESQAESDLLLNGTGDFARNWQTRGITLPPGAKSPVEWLHELGVLSPGTLCIHVVRVNSADIARLAGQRCGVAHCPRSNRRHGHGDAPLRALLDAGLPLGVGTDSSLSVNPPDLVAEARAARALANLTPEATLDLLTMGGARALGMEDEIGSLEIGKYGDFTVCKVPSSVNPDNLVMAVLNRDIGDVILTVVQGADVFRRSDP